MKRLGIGFLLTVCCLQLSAGPIDKLLERIAPEQNKKFDFVITNDLNQKSFFEVTAHKKKIRIKGNAPSSVAHGLNWYLREFASTSYSGHQPLVLPEKMPRPERLIRKNALSQINFFLDPHVFEGPWKFQTWEEWEKQIDLMALNGTNMALAWVGEEAVWQEFLKEYDFTEKEIHQILLQKQHLPETWISNRRNLQRKIIRRMQELGIVPVFRAFTGLVPEELLEKRPFLMTALPTETEVRQQMVTISSEDPEFSKMAQKWYDAYAKVYGTAHYFYGDPGNQKDLATIQRNMMQAVPGSTWIIPTDTEEMFDDKLAALKGRNTLALILQNSGRGEWKNNPVTNTLPWLWTIKTASQYSNNWYGLPQNYRNDLERACNDPGTASYLLGTGVLTDNPNGNQIVTAWSQSLLWQSDIISFKDWLPHFLQARYGIQDQTCLQAWQLLEKHLFQEEKHQAAISVFCQDPLIAMQAIQKPETDNRAYLVQCIRIYLNLWNQAKEQYLYRKDLVDLTREYIRTEAQHTLFHLAEVTEKGTVGQLNQLSAYFQQLILLEDQLLAAIPEYRMSYICQQAECNELYKEEQKDSIHLPVKQLLIQQRQTITGHCMELSGILKEYAYPKWKNHLKWLLLKKQKRTAIPPSNQAFASEWLQKEVPADQQPAPGDLYKTVKEIIETSEKYK